MCGFVGFTGMRAEREAILHRMADRIIHRGPDMEGYHLSGDTPENAVALGFRRLSIIDLAAGKQPMYNEDGTVVVVFNGEIFNFMDLRRRACRPRVTRSTVAHCDTEVHPPRLRGIRHRPGPPSLRGMFAFVVCGTPRTNAPVRRPRHVRHQAVLLSPRPATAGSCCSAARSRALLEHPGFRREPSTPSALRPYLTLPVFSATERDLLQGRLQAAPGPLV